MRGKHTSVYSSTLFPNSAEHWNRKYTKDNRPFTLIYYEAYLNKKDAQEAEMFYKTGYGREIINGKLKNFLVD